MNRKIFYILLSISVIAIIIIIGISIKNSIEDSTDIAEYLNANSQAHTKINNKVTSHIKENGIYLYQTEKDNVTYLILDGSFLNLTNGAPYYSDVKIEKKDNSIMIYFNENSKVYSDGKYPEHRLIYKITTDKDIEYIKVYKNGEESHIDTIFG